ncbi:MAG: RNA-binding protein [Candidatus Nitrosothermus koennekii]|nr:MAG: RNA-binding protein [Candidatus Nitrosothermus koennekii]
MSFEQHIKIPLDRVGVLIGKDGRVKEMIEKSCGVRLDIDSEHGEVTIKGNAPIEKMEPFKAVELVTAIARGFSPDRAKRLLEEDVILQVIDLKEYAGKSRNALERIKGRIIGSNGKARRLIEELSEAYVSIHGHYVAIIGKPEEVKLATDAVTKLASGSMHKSVYSMLESARRKAKMERLKLWEDKYE